MRIALLVHAFPPRSNTGVEIYSAAVARALVAEGQEVEVCAARPEREGLHLAQRREWREGYGLTWLSLSEQRDDEESRRVSPGAAAAFGRFLDREQPDLVHIQHFLGLGSGVIDEARARDIPVLFSAHDAHAFCDDYTLVAPDLSPMTPPDARAQARAQLARGVLDRRLERHDGYLVPQFAAPGLLEEVRAALASQAPEVERRAACIEARLNDQLAALERVEHFESPTRFLAQQFAAAGLRSEVHVRACGVELGELQAAREPHAGPLRVLYLGGYYEHKGAHVLLQAAARCPAELRVQLRGCAGSSDYRAQLERLAADAGADLGGAFERHELAGLLAAADVLALPSLWPENAPFVLREAFGAGVPVLVSDTAALRESVRDGEDGLWLAQGDVEAWSAALQRLASEPEALERLTSGVRRPKSIEEDARELLQTYARLNNQRKEGAQRRRERLPEHLWDFAERESCLGRLPTRELARLGIEGLRAIAGQDDIELPELDGALALLENSERLRERFAAARRSEDWQAEQARDRECALQAAEDRAQGLLQRAASEEQRAAWQAGLRAERDERLEWLARQVQAAQDGQASLAGELQLARDSCAEFERRAAASEEGRQACERELEWRLEVLGSRQEELAWTQEQLQDARAGAREWRAQLAQGEDQCKGMGTQCEQLAAELEDLRAAYEHLELDSRATSTHQCFLESELERLAEQLAQRTAELAWRAGEMRAAQGEASSRTSRLLGGRLARRSRGWGEPPAQEGKP